MARWMIGVIAAAALAASPVYAQPSMKAGALVLEDVMIEPAPDSKGAIVASGSIINTNPAAVTPRRLRLIFKDQDQQTVGEQAFELRAIPIPPNGRQSFRQRVDDLPTNAASFDVTVDPVE